MVSIPGYWTFFLSSNGEQFPSDICSKFVSHINRKMSSQACSKISSFPCNVIMKIHAIFIDQRCKGYVRSMLLNKPVLTLEKGVIW